MLAAVPRGRVISPKVPVCGAGAAAPTPTDRSSAPLPNAQIGHRSGLDPDRRRVSGHGQRRARQATPPIRRRGRYRPRQRPGGSELPAECRAPDAARGTEHIQRTTLISSRAWTDRVLRSAAACCRVPANHEPSIGHPQLFSLPIGTRSPCLRSASCRAMRPLASPVGRIGRVDSHRVRPVQRPRMLDRQQEPGNAGTARSQLPCGNYEGNRASDTRRYSASEFRAGAPLTS